MYSGDLCPAERRNAFWERFLGNGLRMVDVGCELETETRGIDVTRRAESIGEGDRDIPQPERTPPWSVPQGVPGAAFGCLTPCRRVTCI